MSYEHSTVYCKPFHIFLSLSKRAFVCFPVLRYCVVIQTGGAANAGTDAAIFITLHGERGDSGKRLLHNSLSNHALSQPGKADVYILEAVDLGKLHKLTVAHSGKEKGRTELNCYKTCFPKCAVSF